MFTLPVVRRAFYAIGAFILLTGLVLVGCDSPTGEKGWRVLAYVEVGDQNNPKVELPDTVEVGQSFTVTIETYWLTSGTEMEGTEVNTSGLKASIYPYLRDGIGPCCFQTVRWYTHQATLQFEEPGTASIALHAENGTWTLNVVVE